MSGIQTQRRSVLLVMETGVHEENYRPAASHGQTLLYLPCITTKGIVIIGFLVVRRCIGCVMTNVLASSTIDRGINNI
jgi:uncharacterized membrane protein